MAHINIAVSELASRRAAPAHKPSRKAKPAENFIDPARLPKAKYALKVVGDCMAPAVKEGVHVLVDPTAKPKPGDLVIVYMTRSARNLRKPWRPRLDSNQRPAA